MIEVKRSTPASPDRVWAPLSDVENWPRVLPTFRRVSRLRGDGPVGVGSRFEVEQPGLVKAVYEITEWQESRVFTWVAVTAGIRATASHRLESDSDGTQIALTVEWSGPLAWLVRLLLGSKARRMVEQEADAFVRLSEDVEGSD